jgi:putative transposase
MPKGQNRVYGKGHLHFVTCRCYRHLPKLSVEKHRDVFVQLLEEVRAKFRFNVVGYVVMPEHFDLLMSEPAIDTAENSILTLRKRYGRRYNASARSDEQVWETRYADVHLFDIERIHERLAFMHQQPVKAGLVAEATQWEWSSARAWAGLPEGVVTVDRTIDPKALVTHAEPAAKD